MKPVTSHAGDAVEVQRGPAPAAADVEDVLARLQMQLGGDMRLFVGLRLLQAVGRLGEIGAAVLQVVVEEEAVEVVADVVMVGDICARVATLRARQSFFSGFLPLRSACDPCRPPPSGWRRSTSSIKSRMSPSSMTSRPSI